MAIRSGVKYCFFHNIEYYKGSPCPKCSTPSPSFPMETKKSVVVSSKKVHGKSRSNHGKSRSVSHDTKIYERFHSYRLKFSAIVNFDLLEGTLHYLNNNVKFKKLEYPEATVQVFKQSVLIILRSNQEIKGLPVLEAKAKSDKLIEAILLKLPKEIKVKDHKVISTHNAFVNHPTAKVFKESFNREMCIKDDNRQTLLITDNSKGNRELEYIKADRVIDMSVYREDYEKDLITKPSLFPSDVRFAIENLIKIQNDSAKDQRYYAENLRTHVEAIQKLGEGVDRLTRLSERESLDRRALLWLKKRRLR